MILHRLQWVKPGAAFLLALLLSIQAVKSFHDHSANRAAIHAGSSTAVIGSLHSEAGNSIDCPLCEYKQVREAFILPVLFETHDASLPQFHSAAYNGDLFPDELFCRSGTSPPPTA